MESEKKEKREEFLELAGLSEEEKRHSLEKWCSKLTN